MPANSLNDFLSQQGAQFGDVAGETVAQNFGDTNAEHRALTGSVALVDLSFRGCLAVLGDDRVKFINGQVTNEVAALKPGQGCYAALVNAKAKMQADLHVYRLDDELILDFEPGLLEAVTERPKATSSPTKSNSSTPRRTLVCSVCRGRRRPTRWRRLAWLCPAKRSHTSSRRSMTWAKCT